MGEFEDRAAALGQAMIEQVSNLTEAMQEMASHITSEVVELGRDADIDIENCDPTPPPPGNLKLWLPKARPLEPLPNTPQTPGVIGWHDVVGARAPQTGVELDEFKANQAISVHQAGTETLIERGHGDRWLIDDGFDGWTILDGHAGYSRRQPSEVAVQLEFSGAVVLALIVETGELLDHADFIAPTDMATPIPSNDAAFVRRGSSERHYPVFFWQIMRAGWVDLRGLKGTGALFYAVMVDEERSPIMVQPANSIQHAELGQFIDFAGRAWKGFHPVFDPRSKMPHDHEHGHVSRLDLLPWNVSDANANKSGFKALEFASDTLNVWRAPAGIQMVVPQILMHLQTSSTYRVERATHTFDHAVWGVPDDSAGPEDWVPLAMLPFRAQFGEPVAVYGGNVERPLTGDLVSRSPKGERDITVAGDLPPATALPGYESWRADLGQANGIPVEGPIVVVADDPCTRLPHKETVNGEYRYDESTTLEFVGRTNNSGGGARRWVIFPSWDAGKRYVINGQLMVERFGLTQNPETGLLHWLNTQHGEFLWEFDPSVEASDYAAWIEDGNVPCFIHPDLYVEFHGGRGKAWRGHITDQYHMYPELGNFVSRTPLDYLMADQSKN